MLPPKSATLIQTKSLVAQPPAQANKGKGIRDADGSLRSLAHIIKLLGEPVVRLAALVLGLLLRKISLGACAGSKFLGLFTLQTRGLGFSLDLLLAKVGRNGADGGRVDINEGGSRSGCRNNLRGLGGGSLGVSAGKSRCVTQGTNLLGSLLGALGCDLSVRHYPLLASYN